MLLSNGQHQTADNSSSTVYRLFYPLCFCAHVSCSKVCKKSQLASACFACRRHLSTRMSRVLCSWLPLPSLCWGVID